MIGNIISIRHTCWIVTVAGERGGMPAANTRIHPLLAQLQILRVQTIKCASLLGHVKLRVASVRQKGVDRSNVMLALHDFGDVPGCDGPWTD